MTEVSDDELREFVYEIDILPPKNKARLEDYIKTRGTTSLRKTLVDDGYLLSETVETLISYLRFRTRVRQVINYIHEIPIRTSIPLEINPGPLLDNRIVQDPTVLRYSILEMLYSPGRN